MTGEGAMPTYIVDAFTDHRGGGNPAAVIELGSPVSEEWMRLTASDLGLPATVFVQQAGDGPAGPSLRWFTGPRELPSCGHGTLAAAHVALGRDQGLASIAYATRLGRLTATRRGDWIELLMPAQQLEDWQLPEWAVEALGATPVAVVRSEQHVLVAVAEEATVRGLDPDLAALARLPTVGLAVTAPGSGGYDVVSRWFVPSERFEDQATGTAHCLIGPYWAARGLPRLRAWQASRRGGELRVSAGEDGVRIAGQAVTSLHGHLRSA
ncbi:MAG: PhzF family phenazine biosynthesis protein [Frankiaceae bacterium]